MTISEMIKKLSDSMLDMFALDDETTEAIIGELNKAQKLEAENAKLKEEITRLNKYLSETDELLLEEYGVVMYENDLEEW